MTKMNLAIGNRNYSSWSLRAWLALRVAGLAFECTVIPLGRPETKQRILEHSPAGRVPVLRHGDLTVWDSLAICEYAAEIAPGVGLLPEDPAARAAARAASAEMHAGFAGLRAALPMNIRADRPGVAITEGVRAEIDRIAALWRDCRSRFGPGGDFLFGRFSMADAMYAPVVARFATYHVALGEVEQSYADSVSALPAMREWAAAAAAEPWVIESEEVG